MKWISVEDQLPPNADQILVTYKDERCTAYYSAGKFYLDDDREWDAIVTHWMPIPELP